MKNEYEMEREREKKKFMAGQAKREGEIKVPVATERLYTFDPAKSRDKWLPKERRKSIYRSMGEIYDAPPMDMRDQSMYSRGGIQQNIRKREFTEWGRKIALERGIPSYNREVGIPMCQRSYEPMSVQGTDVVGSFDDFNFFNNAAMQQAFDDIRRSVIVNLDVAHRTIQLRLGKEISPETMNLFMETLQHRLAGGAVIQEHMAEVHPGLTSDAIGKVFTGDDELADQFDRRFCINLNEEFHPERADALKVGVGEKLCLAVREPTLRIRNMDGAAIVRSAAQSTTMAFVATYRLTGESVLSDIAFSTRHAQQVRMGETMWANRAHAPNEIGGMPFGYLADIVPAESDIPLVTFFEAARDPELLKKLMTALRMGSGLWPTISDNIWYGQCMAGGIGFPSASYAFLGGGFDDMMDMGFSGTEEKQSMMALSPPEGHERMPAKWWAVKPFIHMAAMNMMEQFDKYPTLVEFYWGGVLRISALAMGSLLTAFMTGDSLLSQMGFNYVIALLGKEGWLRTGWSGQEVQDQCGLAYSGSFRIEEGGLPELTGHNVPYMSYTAGHSSGRVMSSYAAQLGRGSAWACSPLVKVAFADRDLAFDFRHPVLEFAKGAIREFEPAGERDLIRPAK